MVTRTPAFRSRLPWIVGLALASVVVTACSSSADGAGPKSSAVTTSTPPTSTPATSTPKPAPKSSPTTAARIAAGRKAVAQAVAQVPDGAAGVSVTNMSTGKTYTGGHTGALWTASMYKLLVLETLLREHGALGGGELDEATRMIENSDNAAGWSLWLAGGGNTGLRATMRALGMKHSKAEASDPTFTKLTPADATRMLHALVRPGVLSPAARAQALGLMRNVASDQRWGVGVVADKGDDFANKNGWLAVDNGNPPPDTDDGRWVVSSVGIVKVHGQQLLMAAMSEHNASMGKGIGVVEALSKGAAAVVAP